VQAIAVAARVLARRGAWPGGISALVSCSCGVLEASCPLSGGVQGVQIAGAARPFAARKPR
jgi:hypothetical protein